MGVIRSGSTGWPRAQLTLSRLALASVVVNVAIVVTGGAVRLTGSGLGCPTFPSCTEDSLTPTKQFGVHGIIEFTNRQLTFVVGMVVIATLVVALLDRRERRLAVLVAASIPAQALLGGVTVLTHLNPWTVAAHFLLSMVIIATAFALWWRVDGRSGDHPSRVVRLGQGRMSRPEVAPRGVQRLSQVALALTAAVLTIGTVVTGTGPHAGDQGAAHRIGYSPAAMSQLHADAVMLLLGLAFGLVLLVGATGASRAIRRAARGLLVIVLLQGLIGYLQYFAGVPAVLVGVHMFGACLVWLAALNLAAHSGGPRIFRPSAGSDRVGDHPATGTPLDADRLG